MKYIKDVILLRVIEAYTQTCGGDMLIENDVIIIHTREL